MTWWPDGILRAHDSDLVDGFADDDGCDEDDDDDDDDDADDYEPIERSG